MFCITESGRVLDTSSVDVLELINGAWVPARDPLFCDELFNARVLSPDELKKLEKSGELS